MSKKKAAPSNAATAAVTAPNTSTMLAAIAILVEAGIPVLLWGLPGVGKSSAIKSLGAALGRLVEIVIASIREPADFAGIPMVIDGEVHMVPGRWANRLQNSQRGLLVLDEISQAQPATQGALMRVVLDREVGDTQLGDHVSIIAAANPPEIAAGGWDLAPPLANRFCHLDWSLSPETWVEGMIVGWGRAEAKRLPDDWRNRIPVMSAKVAAFIRSRPSGLHTMPGVETAVTVGDHEDTVKDSGDDVISAGKAWASPRTWEMTAIALAAADSVGLSLKSDVAALMVTGLVGSIGEEFLTWANALALPDPETLLADPKGCELPTRGDILGATLDALASAALDRNKSEADQIKRYGNAWIVISRVATDLKQPDIAVASAMLLSKHRPRNAPTPMPATSLAPLLRRAGELQ